MSNAKYARLNIDAGDLSFEEWQYMASRIPNIEVEGNELEWQVYGYLTKEDYSYQLSKPDSFWYVPNTSIVGWFDDEYFEELHM